MVSLHGNEFALAGKKESDLRTPAETLLCLRTGRRRDFLKTIGLGAAGALVPGCTPARSARKRPNIVMVLTDDQGWGDIHSHGNDRIDTPVMDALAASGARFDRFYVSPV